MTRSTAFDQLATPIEQPVPDVDALIQHIQLITLQNQILAQTQAQAQAQAKAQVQSAQQLSIGDLQCNGLARVKQDPPDEYMCHVCFRKGHWIKDCPSVRRKGSFSLNSLGMRVRVARTNVMSLSTARMLCAVQSVLVMGWFSGFLSIRIVCKNIVSGDIS